VRTDTQSDDRKRRIASTSAVRLQLARYSATRPARRLDFTIRITNYPDMNASSHILGVLPFRVCPIAGL
jgi:hypothetical protein